MKTKTNIFQLAAAAAVMGVAFATASSQAAVIINTRPATSPANFTADAGQTFTTGALTVHDNLLTTITLDAPTSGAESTLHYIQVWTDTDQNFTSWDPGTLVASSTTGQALSPNGGSVTWNLDSLSLLTANTVYAFTFTDGPGAGATRLPVRAGLSGGNVAPGSLANGTVFSGGSEAFTGWDIAFDLSTTYSVPEPSSVALIGLGAAILATARRRRATV